MHHAQTALFFSSFSFQPLPQSAHGRGVQKYYTCPAHNSGDKTPEVCGFTKPDTLHTPVSAHHSEHCKRRSDRHPLPHKQHDQSRCLPEKDSRTPCADRKLIVSEEKAPVGALMAAGRSPELHRPLPELIRRHTFHFLPQLLQTQ